MLFTNGGYNTESVVESVVTSRHRDGFGRGTEQLTYMLITQLCHEDRATLQRIESKLDEVLDEIRKKA